MFTTLQDVIAAMPGRGDAQALLFFTDAGPVGLTYADLAARCRQLAAGLRAWGLERGEAAGLMLPASAEAFASSLGIIEAGGAVLPLDAQLDAAGLAHPLADSGARLVFTSREHAATLLEAGLPEAGLALVDVPDDDPRGWGRFLSPHGPTPPAPRVAPSDLAALFYTSGSTGVPKGVPLTHANIVFQQNALVEAKLVGPGDRMLLPLPLQHVYPFVIGIFTSLSLGLTVIVPRSLTGPHILGAINEGRATVIAGVPRLYSAMLTGIRNKAAAKGVLARLLFTGMLSLSAWLKRKTGLRAGKILLRSLHQAIGPDLRVLASGGSPLEADLARDLEALGWKVAVGYGLTETSPILCVDPPGEARPGTVGRPLPGVAIRVAPPPGLDTLPGGVGEVQARGPGVFGGYRNLPEKTRDAFTVDGWFRTGDLGRLEPDGRLVLHGRAGAMIVTQGGENVDPEKVEQALETHPIIAEAGVLAWKGGLAAVIVPEAEAARRMRSSMDEVVREAVAQVSATLPSYMRPSDVAVSGAPLQRTRLGKIRRHLVAEAFASAREGRVAEVAPPGPLPEEQWKPEDRPLLDSPRARAVWDWLQRRHPDARLSPDTQWQLDLGVDSLEWLAIGLELKEAAGLEISEDEAATMLAVRDLLRLARSREAGDETRASRRGQVADMAAALERPLEVLTAEQRQWLRPLGPGMRLLAWLAWMGFGFLARWLFRMEVRGLERLPRDRQFVITPNHVSYLDPFLILPALPFSHLSRMQTAGWRGVAFQNRVNRFFSRLARTVPIDPDRGVAASLALGAAVLQSGASLLWFPEGVRSRTGELREFRPGLGLVLERHPVLVIPALIEGAFEALPPGAMWIRRVPVRITFGEPATALELLAEDRGPGNQATRIMRAARQRVAVMQQRALAEGERRHG